MERPLTGPCEIDGCAMRGSWEPWHGAYLCTTHAGFTGDILPPKPDYIRAPATPLPKVTP